MLHSFYRTIITTIQNPTIITFYLSNGERNLFMGKSIKTSASQDKKFNWTVTNFQEFCGKNMYCLKNPHFQDIISKSED